MTAIAPKSMSAHKTFNSARRTFSILAYAVTACSGKGDVSGPATSSDVATVTLAPTPATIPPGGFVQLAATLKDASGSTLGYHTIAWSSSSTAIATVDVIGKVTGVADGTATITATSEGRSGTAVVTVRPIPLGTIVSIFTGFWTTCAVNTTGAGFCWGSGASGGIGDGRRENRLVPTLVSGGLTFVTLVTSTTHSCGVTAGNVGYCWGGTYGVGDNAHELSPTLNPARVSVTGLAYVGTGQQFSCGLTVSGASYCWGDEAVHLGAGGKSGKIPVAVAGGRTFKLLAVGFRHTCGLTESGSGFCWGIGSDGQLGDGSATDALEPVAVAGALSLVSVAAGERTTCGLVLSGAAYCWGLGSSGQIGDGSNTQRSTPTAVSGGLSFRSISVGFTHTCALTPNGEAYCWGDNAAGALGDGSLVSTTLPVAVSGGLRFSSISSGDSVTCGLTTEKVAYCWGQNDRGQLGNGSTANSNFPIRVADQQ